MCLGVPGLVTDVEELTATVDFWGVRRHVRLDLVDEPVQPGDYVLNHVGFAIRRIPAEDVATTLALYEQLLRENTGKGPEDLMAADVRAEMEAGRLRAEGAPASLAEARDVIGRAEAGGAGEAGRAGKAGGAGKA